MLLQKGRSENSLHSHVQVAGFITLFNLYCF